MKVEEKRIFIKNLPETATQEEIQQAFSDYGKVKKIEIKERKTSLPNQSLFFAYINIEIDDKNLQKCFHDFGSELWHGQLVELQLAKESFLEKLKRERQNEPTVKKEIPTDTNTVEVPVNGNKKTSIPITKTATSSSDSEDDSEPDLKPKEINRKKSVQSEVKADSSSSSESDDEKEVEVSDLIIKNNKHKTLNSSGLKIESSGNTSIVTIERQKRKKSELTESESKRLKSMKNMIEGYKQKKSVIKAALSNVDFKPNKKIVFDEENINDSTGDKGKPALFDSDNESDEGNFNFEVKTQFQGKKGQKLLELQSKFKSDKRFMLDERFLDDQEEELDQDAKEEDTVEDEKQKEYQILEEVLGKRVKPATKIDDWEKKGKKGMLRFDPSLPNHSKYELTNSSQATTSERKSKKKEKNKTEEQNEIADQPQVSKDVFYNVSDDLKQTFQKEKGFSLLSMFGKAEDKNTIENNEVEQVATELPKKRLGSEKNPFRYDSSDEDGEDEVVAKDNIHNDYQSTSQKNTANFWSEAFFFKEDDYRLQEGFDFINRIASEENGEFKQVRRNLKEIARAKIRHNQRKNRPFKKKLGGNKRKKMIRMKKAMKR